MMIDECVAHLLGWHLPQILPLAAAFEGSKLDFLGFDRAVKRVELKAVNLSRD